MISTWANYPNIEKVADRELTLSLLSVLRTIPQAHRGEYLAWVDSQFEEAEEAMREELGL